MKPLRAFLFSSSPTGEWSSSAFRELEPLLDAAQKIMCGKQSSAAIHVGFWRPETTKIAELAKQWSGVLLISEVAIGAFPPPVRVSQASVGEVDGISFRVALDGFGYQIDDPNPESSKNKPLVVSSIKNTQFNPRGWVESLVVQKPDYKEILQKTSIWDDESYRENEHSLEPDIRLSLALDRYSLVAGIKVDESNILDNLHACPDWLLNEELKFFSLTVRLINVCAAHNITTVSDLANKGYGGLLKLPNMGRSSVIGLGTLLWKAFITGDPLRRNKWIQLEPNTDEPPNNKVYEDTFLKDSPTSKKTTLKTYENLIGGFIDAAQILSERERGIWAARLGFRCKKHTLESIANDVGLTRERIRQVEAKIYKKLSRHPFWDDLSNRIKVHLKNRTSPLLLNGISAVDPWFKDAADIKDPLREVFHHILKSEFSIFDVHETPVITRFSRQQWENALNSGKALLREMAKEKISEDFARVQIRALINGDAEELREDLWALVRPFAMWATSPDGQQKIVGYGRTPENVVATILEAAGKPLHFLEIYRRSTLIAGKEYDDRAIHRAAQNIAFLYGQGTYGLLSHCPLSQKDLVLIEAEVEDIADGSEPTKQWHTSELFDELLERGLDFDGKLSKYVINIALRNSKTFSNMRRMVWGYKDSWQASAASRLDMRQAVIALLEKVGRPLSTSEIRNLLKDDRGVNDHFQIHPQGNLIRLGAGLWGLADRDIKVKNLDALLKKLVNHLQSTQEGIHITEVAGLLGGISDEDSQALLGLIKEYNMRRDRGQYVYISDWGESRRAWPLQAVEQVLAKNPQGISIERIRLEVNRLTKREMDPVYISHLLVNTETATYDAENEVWRQDLTIIDDSDEEKN